MKYFLLRLGHKAQSEIISGKKGVRRPPHRPHSTGRDYYWSVFILRFQSLLDWLVTVINQIFWCFLIPWRENKVNIISSAGQQTLLVMICAALATLPTAFLLHQILNKSPINFFGPKSRSSKYRLPAANFPNKFCVTKFYEILAALPLNSRIILLYLQI